MKKGTLTMTDETILRMVEETCNVLSRTDSSDAGLFGAPIRDADLCGLALTGVHPSGASLSEVDLTDLLRSLGVDLEAGNRPPDGPGAAGSQGGAGEISEADRLRLTRAG